MAAESFCNTTFEEWESPDFFARHGALPLRELGWSMGIYGLAVAGTVGAILAYKFAKRRATAARLK